jgi:hypothetical protein
MAQTEEIAVRGREQEEVRRVLRPRTKFSKRSHSNYLHQIVRPEQRGKSPLEARNTILIIPKIQTPVQKTDSAGSVAASDSPVQVRKLPLVRIAAKTAIPKANAVTFSKFSFAAFIASVWLWRSAALIAGMVIAGGLLVYSLLFESAYATFGNATSYFPWAWGENYTSSEPVQNLFYLGIGISLAGLYACGTVLWAIVPELKKAGRRNSTPPSSTKQASQPKPYRRNES